MKLSIFYHHVLEAARQRNAPVEDALRAAAESGIETLEVEAPDTPEQARELLSQFQRFGLSVANVDVTHLDLAHGQPPTNQLDVVEALGCKQLLIVPGFAKPDEDREQVREQLARGLCGFCTEAAKRGFCVTLEDYDHFSAPYATSGEMLWLFERVPELYCTFDTGNFFYSGEDELSAFSALAPRIRHVHCKDRALQTTRGGKPTIDRLGRSLYAVAVGSGVIRMDAVLRGLHGLGYDGALSIEHYGSPDQWSDMIQSAKWLRAAWARTGGAR